MALPAASPSGDNLYMGRGVVYFAKKNGDGTFSAYRHMGNVEQISLQTQDEMVEKYSSMTAGSPLLKSVTKRRDATLKMTADEWVPENVALALGGADSNTAAQAATPVAGEVLTTSAELGGYYKTAKQGPISAVAVKQGVTTLVLNTDYTVDLNTGVVHLLADGGATALASTTIDYTPTAYTDGLPIVQLGGTSSVEGKVMFLGDPASGPKVMVEIWSVKIAPDAALELIADDFGNMTISGKVQADLTKTVAEQLARVTYLAA